MFFYTVEASPLYQAKADLLRSVPGVGIGMGYVAPPSPLGNADRSKFTRHPRSNRTNP